MVDGVSRGQRGKAGVRAAAVSDTLRFCCVSSQSSVQTRLKSQILLIPKFRKFKL